MRVIKIKNVQDILDVYCGQEISPSGYYTLQSETEIFKFAGDEKVNQHLWATPAKIAVNDGDKDLVALEGDHWLKNTTTQQVSLDTPKDFENRPQFRRIVTRADWVFAPHSLDWTTAKAASLYNRSHYGNTIDDSPDMGDGGMLFYDSSGTALVQGEFEIVEDFQARLTASCVKTIIWFEKTNSYDVQAASLYIQNEPTNRAYLWCVIAPDVPEAWGGNKQFMGRGMNLNMVAPKIPHMFDAVSASTINYDPIYHSSKIHFIVKHAVGEQIGVQVILFCYQE